MSDDEKDEAKKLVESVRTKPPVYDPEAVRSLRLADLLVRSVDEIEKLEREKR